MKKITITFIFLLSLLFLTGCNDNKEITKNSGNNYPANQYYTNDTDIVENANATPRVSKTSIDSTNTINEINSATQNLTEEQISEFATKIYDKSEDRQNNLEITCSTLNGHIVKSGETFSFCDTVGKATEDKGYKKAKIFDKDGNVTEGLGGGNCQVSTTLYNAVKDLPQVEIVEQHEHGRDVPYIKKGLDAAVAYGSEDFKFQNNYDYNLIIHTELTKDNIKITISKYV